MREEKKKISDSEGFGSVWILLVLSVCGVYIVYAWDVQYIFRGVGLRVVDLTWEEGATCKWMESVCGACRG